MIVLLVASLLLLAVTWLFGLGTLQLLNRLFKQQITANHFDIFLLGLMTSFLCFNMVSFWAPVNTASLAVLIPFLLIALIAIRKNPSLLPNVKNISAKIFPAGNKLILPLLLLILLGYWLCLPYNVDSKDYHFITIDWYHQYPVIPGLGNLHGRLAFNPASFIISSAWALTGIVGQAIYPLNGVIVVMFYCWLLTKFFSVTLPIAERTILFLGGILLFKVVLANLSSPSSDLLMNVLVFYAGYRCYEILSLKQYSPADFILPLLFFGFAFTAKLSAGPLLLIFPVIIFFVIRPRERAAFCLRLSVPLLLIYLPWLTRNFIMSGYLLYPIKGTNLFPADWVVPHNIIQLEYLFSKFGPRTVTVSFAEMQKMNNWQLFHTWWSYMLSLQKFSLLEAGLAICSLLAWPFIWRKKQNRSLSILLLWLVFYISCWLWLINSPEMRFALACIVITFSIPLFELGKTISFPSRLLSLAATLTLCICLWRYTQQNIELGHYGTHSPIDAWLLPLRDPNYHTEQAIDFPGQNIGHGVTIYREDSCHNCLNAPGPCMKWPYGELELRGTGIKDGFRLKVDEVKKYFPFVN